MKILITGINGQVGSELTKQAIDLGHEVIGISRKHWDMSKDPKHGKELILSAKPDLVINPAAYTNVEGAESNEQTALRVNSEAPRVLASACNQLDIPLFHLSTDYVFDGEKKSPYIETDATYPINAYGRTKLLGELAIKDETEKFIILRTSWVFSNVGENFVKKILKISRTSNEINIVDDEIGGPTCSCCIAKCLLELANKENGFENWGLYHYSGFPYVSRFEFGKSIIKLRNERSVIKKRRINPHSNQNLKAPIKRPKNSCLSCSKIVKTFRLKYCNWISCLEAVIHQE